MPNRRSFPSLDDLTSFEGASEIVCFSLGQSALLKTKDTPLNDHCTDRGDDFASLGDKGFLTCAHLTGFGYRSPMKRSSRQLSLSEAVISKNTKV
jgi:hypothetical protein